MSIHPAVIALVGVAFAALLSLLGVFVGQLASRLAALEAKVDSATSYNRRLWEWARKHIDLYFRYRRDGAPDPDPIPVEDD